MSSETDLIDIPTRDKHASSYSNTLSSPDASGITSPMFSGDHTFPDSFGEIVSSTPTTATSELNISPRTINNHRMSDNLQVDLPMSMWKSSQLRAQWSSQPNFVIPLDIDDKIIREAKRDGDVDVASLIRAYGRYMFSLPEVLQGGNLSGINNTNMSPDGRRLKRIVRKVVCLVPRVERPENIVRTVLTTLFKNARYQAKMDQLREQVRKRFNE